MKTILVVDDDKGILELVNEILEREGYKVITTEGGEEGIDLLMNNSIDLIILDMMMPKINGYDLYKKMKEALSETNSSKKLPPALILTAYPGQHNTQHLLMMESGVKKLVPKPFQIDELLEGVEFALNSKD